MKLIDKDALLAEIEKSKAEALQKKSQCKRHGLEKIMHQISAYNKVLSFIDTLEVKEVDLDFQRFAKEMDAIFALPSSETENTEENPFNWEFAIAKHFFELGVNASNPLTWEDIRKLYIIFAEVDTEIELCKTDIKSETIGYYQEVLKRFKEQKGE